jgi:hypothetical protein
MLRSNPDQASETRDGSILFVLVGLSLRESLRQEVTITLKETATWTWARVKGLLTVAANAVHIDLTTSQYLKIPPTE